MAAKPFLKWAGGKAKLLPELLRRVPDEIDTYYEPFVGGGALFFALKNEVAAGKRRVRGWVLNDFNEELITTYRALRDEAESVVYFLKRDAAAYNQDPAHRFAAVRAYGPPKNRYDLVAARMILLNKTCFNGLYRVNSAGKFNAPWGKHEKYDPDIEGLAEASRALRGVTLQHFDATTYSSKKKIGPKDFFYFDPPYVPVSKTANFTGYTRGGFGPDDQAKLAGKFQYLAARSARVLLSNADTPETRALYKGFKIESVVAPRSINCKGGKRGVVGEILVSANLGGR